MITDSRIREELKNVLDATDIKGIGVRETGKVRDSYKQGDKRVIIVSDRISAFDCVLGTVPFKGQVLNQIAAFWFDKTKDIVQNHVLEVPDPNVMVVKECEQLPLEFVVRGYITGVTKTSAWHYYQQGIRNYCGNVMPEGMKKDQKFDKPILTPTTKHEKHDRPVSRDEAIKEGLISAADYDKVADICFKLFKRGQEHARSMGLILVDTKYEIGKLNGQFVLSDEVHTPDSSRYWFADTYEELFKAGKDQRKLDKEYVREWLAERGFTGDGKPPALTDEVRVEAAKRYIQSYEVITGKQFIATDRPPLERITRLFAK